MTERDERIVDKRLHEIAGHWKTSGRVLGEAEIAVVGTDTYEVLPGGFFLVHHVDVTVGDHRLRAIEIIGEQDPSSDAFLVRSFDSDGNVEVERLTIDDDLVFRFSGGSEVAAAAQPQSEPTAAVRSTLTLAPDRESMSALWERSEDGATWHRWMEISFDRLH